MIRYDLPPVTFSDGLGWGAPFLWVCPNDECPVFRKGFEHTFDHYGRASSMRSIIEPDSGRSSVTPAFTLDAEHFQAFIRRRDRLKQQPAPPASPAGDDHDLDDRSLDPNKDFLER